MLASAILALTAAASVHAAAIERTVDTRAVNYNPVVFDYPTPRGWNADSATQGPCGGLSTNADAVTTYPLSESAVASSNPSYWSDRHDLQLGHQELAAQLGSYRPIWRR